MMDYWAVQITAGNFVNAASVYTADGVLIISGETYTGSEQIAGFFQNFYAITQTFSYTITSDDGSTVKIIYISRHRTLPNLTK